MRTVPSILAVAALVGLASATSAQEPRKSQLATVSQVIASAKVDITYRRPVARGRQLFGALVPWNEVWSPSADTAAMVTLSVPMTIGGSRLDAGTYSLWAIPGQASWSIIFTNKAPIFHTRHPAQSDEVLRVAVAPRTAEHMETLGLYFPMVDADSATLALHWGTTMVPIPLRVVKP